MEVLLRKIGVPELLIEVKRRLRGKSLSHLRILLLASVRRILESLLRGVSICMLSEVRVARLLGKDVRLLHDILIGTVLVKGETGN